MVQINIEYEGDLHCRLVHGPSKSEITTDAPVDNNGKGAAFSPTDLVAAALGSCIMTVMGIVANRHSINLQGTKAIVSKEMVTSPVRRIGKLDCVVTMAKGIDPSKRSMLEHAAHSCPVHKSLDPNINVTIQLVYPD